VDPLEVDDVYREEEVLRVKSLEENRSELSGHQTKKATVFSLSSYGQRVKISLEGRTKKEIRPMKSLIQRSMGGEQEKGGSIAGRRLQSLGIFPYKEGGDNLKFGPK